MLELVQIFFRKHRNYQWNFLRKSPPLVVWCCETRGNFLKTASNPQKKSRLRRGFWSNIHCNYTSKWRFWCCCAPQAIFLSISDAFLSDFPLKNNDFQRISHQNSPKFSPGLRPGCCETRGEFSLTGGIFSRNSTDYIGWSLSLPLAGIAQPTIKWLSLFQGCKRRFWPPVSTYPPWAHKIEGDPPWA